MFYYCTLLICMFYYCTLLICMFYYCTLLICMFYYCTLLICMFYYCILLICMFYYCISSCTRLLTHINLYKIAHTYQSVQDCSHISICTRLLTHINFDLQAKLLILNWDDNPENVWKLLNNSPFITFMLDLGLYFLVYYL